MMSENNSIVNINSSELIALCKSQMALLSQGFEAIWSAVYLTKEFSDDRQTQLIPLIIYPQTDTIKSTNMRLSEVWQWRSQPRLLSEVPLTEENNSEHISVGKKTPKKKYLGQRQQIVLPLMYNNSVMGLLVTIRKDRPWNETELAQVEKIAQTIAIACYLDCRQNFYLQQLGEQENIRQIEHDRQDNFIHQLRNPITALRTFSKLLMKRFIPEDRNYIVAQSIVRESDRLQELIQQFEGDIESIDKQNAHLIVDKTKLSLPQSSFAKASSFLLPVNSPHSASISIKDVLEPLLISYETIAIEKEIKLSVSIPNDLPLVRGNSQALREVFSNLIDNAFKYTPLGGEVTINREIEQEKTRANMLGIAICDTGYGIPPSDRQGLFQRHYRGVQSSGNIPGTGLGLAIAKELVEQMKGEIEVISPNRIAAVDRCNQSTLPGTTFIVWLPIDEEKEVKYDDQV